MSHYCVKFYCPDNEIVTFKGLNKKETDSLVFDWLGSYSKVEIKKEVNNEH